MSIPLVDDEIVFNDEDVVVDDVFVGIIGSEDIDKIDEGVSVNVDEGVVVDVVDVVVNVSKHKDDKLKFRFGSNNWLEVI